MTRIEKLSRIASVFGESTRADESREAFRMAYPAASEEMIGTAAFHVYTDGVDAVIDWLLDAADFVEGARKGMDIGSQTYHVLYHLYNLEQFQALLPRATAEITEGLQDFRALVRDGDFEGAVETAARIEEWWEAGKTPP